MSHLAIFHAASSAHAILPGAGGGLTFAFETDDQLAALEGSLADGLARLAGQPASLGRADPAAYAPDTAHAVARAFAQAFEGAGRR